MPHTGQTITNDITGETITWVRTAADTGGAVVEADFAVRGGGAVPAAHVHPQQTETFVVHEGRCRMVIDGVEREAGPGDTVVVAPGVPHKWGAVTDLRMTVTLEPALRADEFFEDLFAIVEAGGADAKGMPTPLHTAVLVDDYPGLIYLTGAPIWLQKRVFSVLAFVGRRLGRGRAALTPAMN